MLILFVNFFLMTELARFTIVIKLENGEEHHVNTGVTSSTITTCQASDHQDGECGPLGESSVAGNGGGGGSGGVTRPLSDPAPPIPRRKRARSTGKQEGAQNGGTKQRRGRGGKNLELLAQNNDVFAKLRDRYSGIGGAAAAAADYEEEEEKQLPNGTNTF